MSEPKKPARDLTTEEAVKRLFPKRLVEEVKKRVEPLAPASPPKPPKQGV